MKDLSDKTRAGVKDLLTKIPDPVFQGFLLALPAIIEKIQVGKYFEFLEFVDAQCKKDQTGNEIEVQGKLLNIIQIAFEDISKFTPIIEKAIIASASVDGK